MIHPKLKLTIPWESIEFEAQQQIIRILAMPELESLAIMPDVHPGYDLCIGGVALMKGVVSPSFVGYDIGCGMCHVNTGATLEELGIESIEQRKKLYESICEFIPAGAGKTLNASKRNSYAEGDFVFKSAIGDANLDKIVQPFFSTQFGTLGSGNHFLEIGINSEGYVGITIHSGSRRVGYEIASWYIRKGSLLKLDSDFGRAYLADMQEALDFALSNRQEMMSRTLHLLHLNKKIKKLLASDFMINENHNHAVFFGEEMILHRKGATPAEKNQMGIIPANQRDGVWITRGLGNKEYLCSASHGAGRTLSRVDARVIGTVADLEKDMDGVVCRTDKGVLNEASWVYKNIDEVLAAQENILVEVVDHFKPIIVHKG